MSPRYQSFSLTIAGTPGAYTVAARGPHDTSVPPQPVALDIDARLRAELALIRDRAPSRERAITIGTLLFTALFPTPVYGLLNQAQGGLPADTFLRLMLAIQPPELSELPWELLYDPHAGTFLAARLTSPIVRVIESATPVGTLQTRRPAQVLYAEANPTGTRQLDTARSEQALRAGLRDAGIVAPLHDATPADLQTALRAQPAPHVLHFDGHGDFRYVPPQRGTVLDDIRDVSGAPQRDDRGGVTGAGQHAGMLIFQGANGARYDLHADELAAYLTGSSVRLVVLAACKSGADSSTTRFAGLAQHLMHTTSIPAIVAMQYAVGDAVAAAFCRGFYGALADGYPVDAATVAGRQAIMALRGADVGDAFAAPDWATPVLFLRGDDSALFEPVITKDTTMSDDPKQRPDRGGVNFNGKVKAGRDVIGQQNIGGNYVAGNTTENSGVQISGGTVYGPVTGSNSGTIDTTYTMTPQADQPPVTIEQALAAAREAMQRYAGDDDLSSDLDDLVGDLEAALKAQREAKAQRQRDKLDAARATARSLARDHRDLDALAQMIGRVR